MTSANVYYLDFFNEADGVLHCHRQNVMCHEKYDWEKILSLNPETTYILTWGYDEEDEYWDNSDENLPTLKWWLRQMKVTNKELREILSEKK